MHQKCTSNPIINPLPTSKAFSSECEMTRHFVFKDKAWKTKILYPLMESTLAKEIDQTKCIEIDDIVSLIHSLDTLLT
jgi:hypothetical protein